MSKEKSFFCTTFSKPVWWLLALIGAPLLFLLMIMSKQSLIERDLQQRTTQQLADQKQDWAQINLDQRGRDAVLNGVAPNKEAQEQALQLAQNVYGVRVVSNKTTVAGTGEEVASTTETGDSRKQALSSAQLSLKTDNDNIVLTGKMPNQQAIDTLVTTTTAAYAGKRIVNELTIDETVAEADWLPATNKLIPTLTGSGLNNTTLSISNDNKSLSGNVSSEPDKEAIVSAITTAFGASQGFDTNITIEAPATVASQPSDTDTTDVDTTAEIAEANTTPDTNTSTDTTEATATSDTNTATDTTETTATSDTDTAIDTVEATATSDTDTTTDTAEATTTSDADTTADNAEAKTTDTDTMTDTQEATTASDTETTMDTAEATTSETNTPVDTAEATTPDTDTTETTTSSDTDTTAENAEASTSNTTADTTEASTAPDAETTTNTAEASTPDTDTTTDSETANTAEKESPTTESTDTTVADTTTTEPAVNACQGKLNTVMQDKKILFDNNKATIHAKSFPLLNDIAAIIAECKDIVSDKGISINGHTDSRGSDGYNQALSERRANAVKGYLTKKGVNQALMQAIGHGETQPIADNSTDKGRAKNRRITFKIKN